MTEVVLDTSAVIAVFKGEPGWRDVAPLMSGARVSSLNVAEIALWFVRLGMPVERVAAEVEALKFATAEFDQRRAIVTADLWRRTRHRGLSLADRACVALGLELQLPVITADRVWRDLDLGVEIRLIR
jgi:PIN domain nuclease of toxin-antitoxin system